MTTKKVLFLCGSPRRGRSASLCTAKYLARFLDYDYEFVDVTKARLSTVPSESEPSFLAIVEKIEEADAIVWTFGAWVLFVPVQMQYLLDKLIAQGYDFSGKIAAAVLTSVRVHDDFILDRMRFVNEQLGLGYVGDVSAKGNPFFGYEDEEVTEDSCRILAGQINRSLQDGYVPARHYPPVERKYLSPMHRGPGFIVDDTVVMKTGDKTILVITGNRLSEDPANASVIESIRHYSRNSVEVIELQDRQVGPCVGCYLCDFHEDGVCVLKDEYETIKQRLHQVDGIVLVGTCVSGMVDCHLKAFLDRCWGITHRPSLKDKYGFVVATGGGPLEPQAAWYLLNILSKYGPRCLAALTQSAADVSHFTATLRRTVEDLDRALDEKWQIADRFSTRGVTLTFRDLVATSGMMLRADYRFYKEHRMFDCSSPGGVNVLRRLLFKNKKLEQWLIAARQKQVVKARDERLDAYLQRGRLGKGQEI
ncbi:NAD(P)H-dependent oxidoreductase [Desulforhopalus singaporensis]|uniref:NADPH-dependent FMN reductase n=1 Tax=Desulforhopalus singaporensis TaxID=91360 RepID=A0A1H0UYD4_9BACT|nr:NAD(P)H-dependent oxidoreductase [Desulforhopalus singaporensis]SDP71177.1 NADPH-dependent FMN reductase [Desulforhopalus singaporensis]